MSARRELTLHVSRCQTSSYFGGKAYGHPRLVKQTQLKKSIKTRNVPVSVFFFFFFNIKLTQEPITGFNKLSCPQIWNIEKEKDREKEKVGRQASEAQREKEQKKHFLLEEQYEIL